MVAAHGARPNPLDRVQFELEELLISRERSDPAGHIPGLRLALHVIEKVRGGNTRHRARERSRARLRPEPTRGLM